MPIIDNAIYVKGKRVIHPPDLSSTFESMKETGGMGWLGLYRPNAQEMHEVAEELGLHELAVEDTLAGHQRPKLDHYGDHLFVVLRPARYLDDVEKVEFGELHVYVGADFVVTVRHAESPKIGEVRKRMEEERELLAMGPEAVLYAVIDQVVDEYEPVAAGLSLDIDEIEEQLFSGEDNVSRRIYELSREVIEFQRAVAPLDSVIERLRKDIKLTDIEPEDALELDRKFIDVQDHAIRLAERVASFRALLANALSLSSTLASQRATEAGVTQNEQMKKISSWAAILFAPSLIGSIYGMNFSHMPELHVLWGYPAALGLMVALSVSLFVVFKKNNWL
ncbi:magnesium and cobalt transport protein CorA [Paeniglutamicibacter sp. NPDC012692]|uniref:magnesium and cobalt transport protein CorA n=1 Tax=Paeniglutamicibacter sp. NPDC012692 TaxID=3364388 RepID=UPI0036BBC490